MKLKNTSDFPNYFLRRLISFCCRELELPVKMIRGATFRKRPSGRYSGHAWPYEMRFVVSANDREDLIHVTAHEIAHLEQGWRARRQGLQGSTGGRRLLRNGGSERNTESLTKLVLDAFHAKETELLAAWSREPAVVCARQSLSIVEKRATRVEAQLVKWTRKLKLAQTKVKQYKRRVAYYANKTATEIG